MTVYGYARVSTKGQNLSRQLKSLEAAGCETIFEDKLTGTTRKRPALEELFSTIKEGDVIIIHDLTRISRSTQDLLNIVKELSDKGVGLRSLKEAWLDTTSQNAQSNFMLTIFAALGQLERDLIAERTKEGLEVAKEKGKTLGRPKKNEKNIEHAIKMWQDGENLADIQEVTGVSKSVLYREKKKRGVVKN
ncbi:recombinase family protein [Priestia megaterium]|uniref:recombinase family protein n=1 Tax=Priestia megaterium TaxID=1404 RepID=UPI000BF50E93|nr:recombinase family protein [Priestia megaterium]PFW43782.1 hypothetical protein COL17_26605 [Priestia megaterium]